MRKYILFSILYFITVYASGQDVLLHVTEESIAENLTVLKRISPNKYIVKTNSNQDLKLKPKSFLEAPVDWKYTQRFLEKPEKSNMELLIKVLDLELFQKFSYPGISIVDVLEKWNVLIINSSISNAKKLLGNDNNVVFIDLAKRNTKVREESLIRSHDLSINSILKVHNDYPLLKGENYNVSVKELSIDTSDIDLIERTFSTSFTDDEVERHATDMATLIGGAGNSFLTGLGVARDVNFTSASFSSLFPEDSSYYSVNDISVQNHSYGVGIENFYGVETEAYDQTIYDNPGLMHVFSAGNSGNLSSQDGVYQNLSGFANITGNFKQSKNTLSVTALDKELNIPNVNSRGPAYDGRIKPELTAFGGEGTSEAAALVSGASILLKSYYESKYNAEPSASMVKSLLIAGANDIGPGGIDFISGYGNLNLSNSLDIINMNDIVSNSISENEELAFDLSIPDNTHHVRIAMVWTDPPANPNDFKALVNNLDLRLENISTGQVWYPWVLNPYPHPDSLLLPPVRGLDTLNNVELITIDLPEPGDYNIIVSTIGQIQNGNQSFSISSHIQLADLFTWINPVGGNPMESGVPHYLRWEESLPQQTGKLDVKYGTGNWETINNSIDLEQQYFEVLLKDTAILTQLRMDISGTFYTSEPFLLSPQIRQDITVDCENSLLLEWSSQLNAISYELSSLQGKSLAPINLISDTLILIDKEQNPERYFAVTPIYKNEVRGIRSLAIDYTNQGAGCYINSFFVSLNQEEEAEIQLQIGSSYNVNRVTISKRDAKGSQVLSDFVNPGQLEFIIIDDQIEQGYSYYTSDVELLTGGTILSEELEVLSLGDKTVLFFPNPVRQGEDLTILSKEQDSIFKVFDSMGKIVVNNEIRGTTESFTVLNLQKGLYIYKVLKDDQVLETGRLVIY